MAVVFATQRSSSNAVLSSRDITSTGTGTLDAETIQAIANAVVIALMATMIPVNIKKINDTTVYGTGTNPDPWR